MTQLSSFDKLAEYVSSSVSRPLPPEVSEKTKFHIFLVDGFVKLLTALPNP